MIVSLELLLALTPYAALAVWYAMKASINRRLVSVATSWLALGWVYALGRDAHWLSRVSAAVLVVITGAMGWVSLAIVFHIEKQRP